MKKLREDLDKISLSIYSLSNLAQLLEDYFYNSEGDKEFEKNQTLSIVVVEKIKEIDKSLEKLYKSIYELER